MSSFNHISNWFQSSNDDCNESDHDVAGDAGSSDDESYSENQLREIEESLYSQIHYEPNETAEECTVEETILNEYKVHEINEENIFNISEILPVDEVNVSMVSSVEFVPSEFASDASNTELRGSKRKLEDLEDDSQIINSCIPMLEKIEYKKPCGQEPRENLFEDKKKKLSMIISQKSSILFIEKESPDNKIKDTMRTNKKIKSKSKTAEIVSSTINRGLETSTNGSDYIAANCKKKNKKVKPSIVVMDLTTDSGTDPSSVLRLATETSIASKQKKKEKLKKSKGTPVTKVSVNPKCIVVSDSSSIESGDEYLLDQSSDEDVRDCEANDIQLHTNRKGEDSIQLSLGDRESMGWTDSEDQIKLKEMLNSLLVCDWSINEMDRYGETLGGASRYYNSASRMRCHNCNQKGHSMASCPQPRKVISCSLCGRTGHWYYRCSDSLCFKCHQSGHTQRDCLEKWSSHTQCKRCQRHGHRRVNCPDKWRQYHLTTSAEGKLVKTSAKRVTLYCYNCGHNNHLGYECIKPRMNTRCPSSLPYPSCYNDNLNSVMDTTCPPGFKSLRTQKQKCDETDDAASRTEPSVVKKFKKKAADIDSQGSKSLSTVKKVKRLTNELVNYSDSPKQHSIKNKKETYFNTEPSVEWRRPPHRNTLNGFVKMHDLQAASSSTRTQVCYGRTSNPPEVDLSRSLKRYVDIDSSPMNFKDFSIKFKQRKINENNTANNGMQNNTQRDTDEHSIRKQFQDSTVKRSITDTFKRRGKLFRGHEDAEQSFLDPITVREEHAWNLQLRSTSTGRNSTPTGKTSYSQNRRDIPEFLIGKDTFTNDFSFDEGMDYMSFESPIIQSPKSGATARLSRQQGRGKSSRGFSFENTSFQSRSRSDSEHQQVYQLSRVTSTLTSKSSKRSRRKASRGNRS